MKSSLVLFSVLLILAFTFTSKPFFVLSETDAVVDNHGEPLQTGVDYYIISLIRGAGGGGVNLSTPRQGECPLAVVQEPLDLLRGRPVKFFRVDGKSGAIPASTDLNIRFSTEPETCERYSTVWKVGPHDTEVNQHFVITGGVLGKPGCKTERNWFKIEKAHDRAYKIVFCPSVCSSHEVLCKDVGRYFGDGKRRLALSDSPFVVYFVKA